MSGAGRESGGAERSVKRAWQKMMGVGAERGARSAERGARSGRSRSGNGAGSGLNRPLTARSNITFH